MTSIDSIVVVIPAYNEFSTIREVASRARSQCKNVIVIDDGSTDGTAACLVGLDVTVIRHERNLRKAAAISHGMQAAIESGAHAVVTLDGDGQHRPEDIPILAQASRQWPDTIIIGARLHQKKEIPSARYRANQIANFWISWAAGYSIQDSQSGFRLYPTTLLKQLDLSIDPNHGFVFESEILIEAANLGVKSHAVQIPAIYAPNSRPSHFRPVADITNITLMVAGRLIRRGLFLPGLYRSYIRAKVYRVIPQGFDKDALLTLALSSLAAVSTLCIFYLWFIYRVNKTAAQASYDGLDADALMVLSHRLADGEISEDFKLRLEHALRLYTEAPMIDLHIVGGRPSAGTTEADAGYQYLIEKSVDPTHLFREGRSSNTVENLVRSRLWLMSYRQAALVSNRYHLERILTIAAGMDMPLLACGAEQRYTFRTVFPRSLIEAFFLHWYWTARIFGQLSNNTRILRKVGQQY